MNCPYNVKVCGKCKRILIACEINFTKAKKGKYGFSHRCKECDKQYYKENKKKILDYHKQYYEENKEEILDYHKQYYEENKEEINKKNKQYHEEHKEEIAEYKKQYYEENKEYYVEYHKQYYEEHKEEIAEYGKQYREENKDEIAKRNKKYREENKEKIKQYKEEHRDEIAKQRKQYREENKEKIAEYMKQYREENPHISFNNHIKRRQLEESQGNGISKEQWLEMMNYFNWCCAYSGEKLNSKEVRTIDHIVALDNGGLNEVWNCVPMYRSYNCSKGIKDMELWYREQDFFSEDRLNKIYAWIEYAYNIYNFF